MIAVKNAAIDTATIDILSAISYHLSPYFLSNIVKLREENGFTQKDLAKKTGIKEYRISNMENVKIRIDLDAVEELAKALNVSADYLTDAELDYGGEECLYQVWLESDDRFKLYITASSKRMAFLKFDKRFKECGVRYNSSRERIFIKLVGIPVSKEDFQARFPKRAEEDLPIEPEM